jgi:diguanylate cyclase (GGDEF)-like protein
MRVGPTRVPPGFAWIAAAYASLAILIWIDAVMGDVHLGVLAIVPLMIVGFYCGRPIALGTALFCAVVFAMLDHDVLQPLIIPRWPIAVDAAVLAVIFVAILFTADRLRASEFAAHHDSVTTLLNRRAILAAVGASLERSKRLNRTLALLFVDLDDFKRINDRHGHAVGDRVLVYAAERLARAVRAKDVVGRLGGDEFVVLLEDIGDRAYAERVAASLEAALSVPFREGAVVEAVGATIGIGVYPVDAQDSEGLLTFADHHMYARKTARKALA